MQLQLSKTCSIPKISQSKLYSLRSTSANRPTVLVIQEDKCDISESITQAKKSGYAGIIFCTDTIERFRHVKPLDGFYASVILNSDNFQLSKFDSTRWQKIVKCSASLPYKRSSFLQVQNIHFSRYKFIGRFIRISALFIGMDNCIRKICYHWNSNSTSVNSSIRSISSKVLK